MSKQDKKRFVRLSYDGSSCICRPEEVDDMMRDADDPDGYTREDVWMSEAAFNKLPDFAGF